MGVIGSDLLARLEDEIQRLPIVDTHDRLQRPEAFPPRDRIDFGRLFTH